MRREAGRTREREREREREKKRKREMNVWASGKGRRRVRFAVIVEKTVVPAIKEPWHVRQNMTLPCVRVHIH